MSEFEHEVFVIPTEQVGTFVITYDPRIQKYNLYKQNNLNNRLAWLWHKDDPMTEVEALTWVNKWIKNAFKQIDNLNIRIAELENERQKFEDILQVS